MRCATRAARLVGAMLRLRVGDQPAFSGQITAVENDYGPSRRLEVRVRGYDLLHRLRKRQPVRAHVQVSAADLARELASDLGVALTAADPGPTWRRVMQSGQSDLDLLVEVAERSGLYVTLRGRRASSAHACGYRASRCRSCWASRCWRRGSRSIAIGRAVRSSCRVGTRPASSCTRRAFRRRGRRAASPRAATAG